MLCGTLAAFFISKLTWPASAMALTAVKASAPVGSASIVQQAVLGHDRLVGDLRRAGLSQEPDVLPPARPATAAT